MAKTREHTIQVRQMCVDLHKSGNGYKKIATRLNLPVSTVRGIIKKFKTTGTVTNKAGRGPKFILPQRTVRRMVREVKKSPKLTVTELHQRVASWGHKVSKTTIRRSLHANKLFGRHARKKPILTNTHKRKHLEFAKRHWDFNWDRVLLSDETKIELFGNKHSKWVWRKTKDEYAKKHLMPNVKYRGGSVMLWACFSSKGPGNLVRVHGIMTALNYQDILNKNLMASARKLKMGRHWVFQQDNDPKHVAKSTQKWFSSHKLKVLPWPSQSPDLNPIENLWGELKRRVHKRGPRTLDDLERLCKEEWSKIPLSVFSNLVKCYRRRLRAVLLAKGGCTKY